MRTPSRVPRILLSIFVIIAGAVLTGLFALWAGLDSRNSSPHHATDEVSLAMDGISLALGALAGAGAGALWSLLMNRLPPAASTDRIMPRGIGLGAVAGPLAMLLGYLGPKLFFQTTEYSSLLYLILIIGIPTGMAAGLACSLLAWGVSAWERIKSPDPHNPPGEYAYMTSLARHPRYLMALFVFLSSVLCGAVIYWFVGMSVCGGACPIGALAGAVAGGLAATLWLFVMTQLPPEAGYARTILTGGAIGAAEIAFVNPIVILFLATVTRSPNWGEVFALLFLIFVALGAMVGLVAGSVFGMLISASRVWERSEVAKEKSQQFFAKRGLNNLGSQPNP
jgi:MFS family permease